MASEERSFLSVEESSEESTQSSNEDEDEDINFQEHVDEQLSQLPRAKSAEIGRKRRVLSPAGSRKRKRCGPSTSLKTYSMYHRVKEFSGERFSVEGGKLFGEACWCTIEVKKSLVKQHISSKRHVEG